MVTFESIYTFDIPNFPSMIYNLNLQGVKTCHLIILFSISFVCKL